MIERDSTLHDPREDDELVRELRGTLQGNRSSRAEEWHDPEPPADDDPEPRLGDLSRSREEVLDRSREDDPDS